MYLKNNFVKINEHYQHNFVTPKIKGMESTSFYYNAIQDWNSLPDSIKSTKDLQKFKKRSQMSPQMYQ